MKARGANEKKAKQRRESRREERQKDGHHRHEKDRQGGKIRKRKGREEKGTWVGLQMKKRGVE